MLPLMVEWFTVRVPPSSTMPPPPTPALLPRTVELFSVKAAKGPLAMPPPRLAAVLALMIEWLRVRAVRAPWLIKIPPPPEEALPCTIESPLMVAWARHLA